MWEESSERQWRQQHQQQHQQQQQRVVFNGLLKDNLTDTIPAMLKMARAINYGTFPTTWCVLEVIQQHQLSVMGCEVALRRGNSLLGFAVLPGRDGGHDKYGHRWRE